MTQTQPHPDTETRAYEDRLRIAREAVKSDSKRVAQVVKGWLDDEAAA